MTDNQLTGLERRMGILERHVDRLDSQVLCMDATPETLERYQAYEECTGVADDCTCYAHLRDRIASLTAERDRLQERLAVEQNNHQQCRRDYADLENKLMFAKGGNNHLQKELDRLTAERDAAKRQLAIAVEYVDALHGHDRRHITWCKTNGVENRAGVYFVPDSARRCLEMISVEGEKQ